MFKSQIRERYADTVRARTVASRRSAVPVYNPNWHSLATGVSIDHKVPSIQTQLEVGAADDEYEQEADNVADQVMRMPESSGDEALTMDEELHKPIVQRQPLETNKEEEIYEASPPIQTKRESSGGHKHDSRVVAGIGQFRGGGEPLSASVRSYFEPRMGQDFSGVRIHNSTAGANAARRLKAKAFTFRNNIVFAGGRYQPESNEGRHLLAHELTHVVQQGAGKTSNLQCSPDDGPGGGLNEPNLGSVTFRIRGDGRLEIVAGAPEVPGLGNLGIGARRLPDGSWRPVFGRNPATSTETYSWQEILDLVRGLGRGTATTPGAIQPGLSLPGSSGLSPTSPGLPATSTIPGLTPPNLGATPMLPSFSLTEPSLDFSRAQRVVLDSFTVDQHTLTGAHNQTLDGVALRLRIDDVRVILVYGHTDTTGTEAHNEGLARRRAEAVRDALIERGVDATRLVTEGYGETEPAVSPERSAAERARNRRVELFWLRPTTALPRLRLD